MCVSGQGGRPEGATPKGRLLTIRVLIGDDSGAVRDRLRGILVRQSDVCVLGEALNSVDAIDEGEPLRPSVVLMDVRMP